MRKLIILLVIGLSVLSSCASSQLKTSPNALNSEESQNKPYVVLVSLDGFRADYLEWYSPPFLKKLKSVGLSAQNMIPTYPSKTFTNHLSIVTGLYAENHGIVDNVFYDPARGQEFRASTPQSARDGSWFSGTPLWVAAEKHGMRSAVYYWPGNEAEIDGYRPSYYFHYNKKTSVEERIKQIERWIKLPPQERPHFYAIYFSDVDSAGHEFGPKSKEVKDAVLKLDQAMAQLSQLLEQTQLPINLVIVSDHGMQALDLKKVIYLEDFVDLGSFKAVGDGTHVHIYSPQTDQLNAIYQKLKKNEASAFKVYKRAELPKRYHYSKNPRAGDIIVAAQDGFTVIRSRHTKKMEEGNHGYDPEGVAMRALFLAKGPQIKSPLEVKPFQNIEVYPFILKLLDLPRPQLMDASGDALSSALNPVQSE